MRNPDRSGRNGSWPPAGRTRHSTVPLAPNARACLYNRGSTPTMSSSLCVADPHAVASRLVHRHRARRCSSRSRRSFRRARHAERARAARRRRLDLGGVRPRARHRLGRPSRRAARGASTIRIASSTRASPATRPPADARGLPRCSHAQAGDRRDRARRQRRIARRQPRIDARQSSRDGRAVAARRSEAALRRDEAAAQLRRRVCPRIRRAVRRGRASAARRRSCPFFFEGFGERNEMFQPDRIHPTAAAQPLLLDNVWPAARARCSDSRDERCPPRDRDDDTVTSTRWRLSASASTCAVPPEYADDHVPGAQSHPVLDDAERARIGTMHARRFGLRGEARRRRARRAQHRGDARRRVRGKPRDWAPLVYCWRGGQRSRSLMHVMNEIGWRAVQLEGGYRAYRRKSSQQLADAAVDAFATRSSAASPDPARAA